MAYHKHDETDHGRPRLLTDRITCTIAETCGVTGLGKTTICHAIADGRLQSVKVGKRRLVVVRSLSKWLKL
jgi:excisionase family DNA binding protein